MQKVIRRIKRFAPSRLRDKYLLRPRAKNDYATHVPILIGLAQLREIRSVLEFGCGHYSTLTFLNRAAFPHLERLESVENDISWAKTMHEIAKEDGRWTLKLVAEEMADSVSKLDLEEFDLLLIDDSKTTAQRTATIRSVIGKRPQHPWIVIHDFEVEDYRNAACGFRHANRFRAYNPETGLVWNRPTDANSLKSLDRVLQEKCKTLQPNDVEGWVSAFCV